MSFELEKTMNAKYRRKQHDPMLLLLVFPLLWTECSAIRRSHYVHWNTSNPIFRIDNTDHIIDVNRGNQPWEYDQVNIICPLYHPSAADEAEKYIIYSVTKEEYEACRITTANPRVIAQCTEPHQLMYFTITFRSFTPTPGGMEFKPGKDYYFISTSSHEDLHRRVGGRCSSHNMKVQFKVADNQHESTPSRAINAPRRRPYLPEHPLPSPESTSSSTTTTKEEMIEFSNEQGKLPMYYGDLSYPYGNEEDDLYGSNKKHQEYEVHPNDVIKHEASRMAAGASSGLAAGRFNVVLLAGLLLKVIMTMQW